MVASSSIFGWRDRSGTLTLARATTFGGGTAPRTEDTSHPIRLGWPAEKRDILGTWAVIRWGRRIRRVCISIALPARVAVRTTRRPHRGCLEAGGKREPLHRLLQGVLVRMAFHLPGPTSAVQKTLLLILTRNA